MKKFLIDTNYYECRWINGLQKSSGMVNKDAMVAKAVEQYLAFHKHVESGAEIIVRTYTGGGYGRFNIVVPLKWEDHTCGDADQNALIRKMNDERVGYEVLQIVFDTGLYNQLEQFVKNGYAPSITALIGAALQIFATTLPILQNERGHVYAKMTATEVKIL